MAPLIEATPFTKAIVLEQSARAEGGGSSCRFRQNRFQPVWKKESNPRSSYLSEAFPSPL
jgi:hypothetical protein